jgi:hypothetical protein
MLLLLGSYWLLSDWPSGAMMTLIATVTVGLSAATPNPKRMSFQMACGTAIGALIGFFEMFFVFPWIDGFPLLCMVLAPVFVLGAFLTSPGLRRVGLGLLVFFAIGSVPDNLTVYNPYTFINDYIGMVIGMFVCAAAGAIILPPNSRWLWSRLEQDCASRCCSPSAAPARPGLGLRKPHPRPAAPGLWPGGRQAAGAKRPDALDVRGAGSRPRRSSSCARSRPARRCTRPMPNRSPGARRSA